MSTSKKLLLGDLKKITGSTIFENGWTPETVFTGVSIDSRTIKSGELFLAISGEQFDGHIFLDSAIKNGASGVIVAQDWEIPTDEAWKNVPIAKVPDTSIALRELALLHRKKFDIPIVGITGTNGKTTTKEMIAAVLEQKFTTVKTAGNYNNLFGLPLTLFKLDETSEVAVIEMGASEPGEIAKLCEIGLPTLGLITNIGMGHIEFFKSEEEVLATKSALLKAVENNGLGFINGDDHLLAPLKAENVQSFGFNENCDVMGSDAKLLGTGCYSCAVSGGLLIELPVPGFINLYNALAAVSVGRSLGIDDSRIAAGLKSFKNAEKRMDVTTIGGITFINDSYNANPNSMKCAIQMLAEYPAPGRKIAVLGDMLEIGPTSIEEHKKIGALLVVLGIDLLITTGNDAFYISDSASEIGHHFNTREEATKFLDENSQSGDVVLLKGSRGSKMETILELL